MSIHYLILKIMKKVILIFSILAVTFISASNISAQHVSININIGSQPAWGPVGYDYVDYYYIPDINVYYIVNSHMYVYPDRGRWIQARYLPNRYRHYDLYNMYKVILVGGPHNPWIHNKNHYKQYNRYRGYRGQSVIRDSRDNRYQNSRRNYASWYRDDNSYRVTRDTRPAPRPMNNDRTNISSRSKNSSERTSTVSRRNANDTRNNKVTRSNNGRDNKRGSVSRNSNQKSSNQRSSNQRSATWTNR